MGKKRVTLLLSENARNRLDYHVKISDDSKSQIIEDLIMDNLRGPLITEHPTKIQGGFSFLICDKEGE